MERLSNRFYVIEPDDIPPLPQFGKPEFCRYCNSRLNQYNPLDACWCCREAGKKGFHRAEKIPANELEAQEFQGH